MTFQRGFSVLAFCALFSTGAYADTFVGLGTSPKFSDPANWGNTKVPVDGADLFFPNLVSGDTLINDLPAGQNHNLYFLCNGMTLQGNSMNVSQCSFRDGSGNLGSGVVVIEMPMTFSSDFNFIAPEGCEFFVKGDFTGTVADTTIFVNGGASAPQGTVRWSGKNSFRSNIVIAGASTLDIQKAQSLPGEANILMSNALVLIGEDSVMGHLVGSEGELALGKKTLYIGKDDRVYKDVTQDFRANITSDGGKIVKIGTATYSFKPETIFGACTIEIEQGGLSMENMQAAQTDITVFGAFAAELSISNSTVQNLTVEQTATLTTLLPVTCMQLVLRPESLFQPQVVANFDSAIRCNDAIVDKAFLFPQGKLGSGETVVFLRMTGTSTVSGIFTDFFSGEPAKQAALVGLSGGVNANITYNDPAVKPSERKAIALVGRAPTIAKEKLPTQTKIRVPPAGFAPFNYMVKATVVPIPDVAGGSAEIFEKVNGGLGARSLGVYPVDATGVVRIFTTNGPGIYDYTAKYLGNATTLPSDSNVSTTVITKWPTVIRYRRTDDVIAATTPFTLKEDVLVFNAPRLPTPGAPTGSVAIRLYLPDGTEQTVLGFNLLTRDLLSSIGRFETPVLAPGDYELRFQYSGDASHNAGLDSANNQLKEDGFNRQYFTVNTDGSVFIPDKDGDGFADSIPGLLPSDFVFENENVLPLGLKSFGIKESVDLGASSGKDTIMASGTISGGMPLKDNYTVLVSLGDQASVLKTFVLNSKGTQTVKTDDTFRLSLPKNGVSSFTLKLSKGTFGALLAKEKFPTSFAEVKNGKATLPLGIFVSGGTFRTVVNVTYSIAHSSLSGKLSK